MGGFLLGEHYKDEVLSRTDMNIVSIIFGFCIGTALFTAAKAAGQSQAAYRRGNLFNTYIVMIWLEWIGSNFFGLVSYLWMSKSIGSSFWVFFFIIVFWSMQIQFILQIIINRISVLMVPKTKATKIKIAVALLVGAINISGFCIWIPARLQINDTFEVINVVWDRTEKGVFLLIDAFLNFYFIYLVRTRLVKNGLHKYNRLLYFNIASAVFSVALDVVLMGATFIPSPVVYLQFHPMVYLLKLWIEMNITTLISKIVKDKTPITYNVGAAAQASSYPTKAAHDGSYKMTAMITASHLGHDRLTDEESGNDEYLDTRIRKTVETDVKHVDGDDAKYNDRRSIHEYETV